MFLGRQLQSILESLADQLSARQSRRHNQTEASVMPAFPTTVESLELKWSHSRKPSVAVSWKIQSEA